MESFNDENQNSSDIYYQGESNEINTNNISAIQLEDESFITYKNFGENQKENTEYNELDKDKFLNDIKKYFKYCYEMFNYLLNYNGKIQFPMINGNKITSYINFLNEINKIYTEKNKNINNKSDEINEKLTRVLFEIIFYGNNKKENFITYDSLFDALYRNEKYTPNNNKENKKCSKEKKTDINLVLLQMKMLTKLDPFFENFKRTKNYRINHCKFITNDFDSRGDFLIPNLNNNIIRGSEIYYPPYMWIGIGLNVCGKYEENGDWLMTHNKDSIWANTYLGFDQDISDIKANLHDLAFNNEKLEKYEKNIDFKDKRHWIKRIDKGIYLYNKIENAENYAGILDIDDKKYKILFMVRVKIDEICQPKNEDIWALDKKYIRIYRILFKEINNIN